MAKLIQLPNGDWIDPADVHAIVAYDAVYPAKTHSGLHIPPRVVVHARVASVIHAESLEKAEVIRDELAQTVNA
jgi:hypothetical protein